MRYQVAIVGGGPAGAWLARELARQQVSVLLCERSPVAGEPNFSSAGSPIETVAEFDLPRSAIAAEWDAFSIATPNREVRWTYDNPVGHVYDFRALKKELLQQATESGADVRLGTQITRIRLEDGTSTIFSQKDESFTADIIVDASGPAGVLASQLGLRKKKPAAPSPGLEILCEHPSFRERQGIMAVYFGSTWAPYGYAWVFPMGGTTLKIGVGIYRPDERQITLSLEDLLAHFAQRLEIPNDAHTIETHGGYLYLTGGIRNHVAGNVIAIGDAADQVHPVFAEGIRHVLHSARLAKDVIMDALHQKDARVLNRYNRLWRTYVGRRWKSGARISGFLYARLSDRGYDRIADIVSHLTPKEIFAVGFHYRRMFLLRACVRFVMQGGHTASEPPTKTGDPDAD